MRALADPNDTITITANERGQVQRYRFVLMTTEQVIALIGRL